jgi:hypothetical protein
MNENPVDNYIKNFSVDIEIRLELMRNEKFNNQKI